MHFYSIGYREFLELPVSVFWELAKNIDRIRAEEDRRQFRTLASAIGTAFGVKPDDFLEALQSQQGKIVEVEESGRFEKAEFDSLRAKMITHMKR